MRHFQLEHMRESRLDKAWFYFDKFGLSMLTCVNSLDGVRPWLAEPVLIEVEYGLNRGICVSAPIFGRLDMKRRRYSMLRNRYMIMHFACE